MQYAPIALFTYNRPDKTQRVLESLMQNAEAKESDLFIFSDGPKNEKAVEWVRKNREYIHQVQETSREFKWFKDVTIIEREKNWGLANSLIAGITEVINKYGRIIVVEDDLILSPYFLKFMNDGLEKYENQAEVGAITGYSPKTKDKLPETFFLYNFHCWGWGAWKRSWDLLITNPNYLLRKLRFKTYKFDRGGVSGDYGTLLCQKKGLVDSWYIQFYGTLFVHKLLVLYPGRSMVSNFGLDGSGIHCNQSLNDSGSDMNELSMSEIFVTDIPIQENLMSFNLIKESYCCTDERANWIKQKFFETKGFIRRLLYIDCL